VVVSQDDEGATKPVHGGPVARAIVDAGHDPAPTPHLDGPLRWRANATPRLLLLPFRLLLALRPTFIVIVIVIGIIELRHFIAPSIIFRRARLALPPFHAPGRTHHHRTPLVNTRPIRRLTQSWFVYNNKDVGMQRT
jgi:hypothetical protein